MKINSKIILYLNGLFLAMVLISIQTNFPLYAKALSISTESIGLILSANPLSSIIFSLPFAIMSDKISRKPVIFCGLFFAFLTCLILYTQCGLIWFISSQILIGMAMASFFPAAIALITDLSEIKELSRNIAKFTAVMYAGFLISPFISGLIGKFYNIKSIFLFLLILSILNLFLALIIFRQKDLLPKAAQLNKNESLNSIKSLKILVSVLFLALALGFSQGVIHALWPIYLNDLNTDIWLINLSYTVYAIPIVFAASFIGKWCDKNANLNIFILYGGLFFAFSQLSYIFIPIPLALTLLTSIEGLGYAMFFPPSNTVTINCVEKNFKGRALGLYNFLRTAGQFLGTLVSGFLYKYGVACPFLINAFAISISVFSVHRAIIKENVKK